MITRDPAGASGRKHDLVIIGGGIYGACLALEAARRGLQPLVLERGDFGEATSWNSLRFLHGGLRYLQTLDLGRVRESVTERRWFCRTFPELVRPQECLMPLYGQGLKRPSVFAAALLVNDLLSFDRNAGVDAANCLGRGRVLNAAETIARFPLVDRHGLRGAGLWYDVTMPSSQRVLIEILRWACSLGATALNYVEATGLVRHGEGIGGVEARDAIDGRSYTFESAVVCNCAGPWSPALAKLFDRPALQLFRPSLAFNVLLDCEVPSTAAVAVAPRRAEAPVYFLYPALGGLLAGTVHLPWRGSVERPAPTEEQLRGFLSDLNDSVPGLGLRLEHIVRVFAGLLPARSEGTANLSVRPVIQDHGKYAGPKGLISVSGVKFTTARLVAEQVLATLGPRFGQRAARLPATRPPVVSGVDFMRPGPAPFGPEETDALRRIVREEAVTTIDDLLMRRLNWAIAERDLESLSCRVRQAIGWSDAPARPFGQGADRVGILQVSSKVTG